MIADELNKLKQTKAQIKQALIDKGQNPTDEFASYVGNIAGISGEDPFLELGYPMPNEIIDSINAGIELKDNWNLDNTNYSFEKTVYLPIGLDTSKIKYFSNSDLILYFPGCDLSGYTSQYLTLSGAIYAEFNNIGSELYFNFSNKLHKVVFNRPIIFYRNNSYSNMFTGCKNLKEIVGLNNLIPSTRETTFNEFFKDCYLLETEMDLRDWNTSNITNMESTFSNCRKITNVDISTWDTSKVTTMYSMFNSCYEATDYKFPDNFGSSSTNFNTMFAYNKSLKNVDFLNKFNTSNVVYMNYMFNGCESLEHIDISTFDLGKVTNFGSMFMNCTNLKTVIFPDSATENCDIGYLFSGCSNLEYAKIPDFVPRFSIYNFANNNNKLIAVDGSISLKKYTSSSTFNNIFPTSCRRFVYKDIGYNSTHTSTSLSNATRWGIETDDVRTKGAKQSVIDSLITYSFDRAAAGYSASRIWIANYTKELLTEDEIAQITAKGYTLI